MATSSISKGCFAFKPKKVASLDMGRIFARAQEFECPSQTSYDVYADTWRQVTSLIEDFRSRIYSAVFDDIVAMLKQCRTSKLDDVIPTAVLISGVNLPDHECMFESLCASVRRCLVSSMVCLLTAEQCQSVAAAVKHLVTQLTRSAVPADRTKELALQTEYESDDDLLAPTVGEPGAAAATRPASGATMSALLAFYRRHHGSQDDTQDHSLTGNKRRRLDAGGCTRHPAVSSPPLVVVFKDLESFSPGVLQDLVLICSRYSGQLPFVFVLGVSTSPSVVHQMLPRHVSTCVSLTTFSCQISSRCLQQFIDQVLLSDSVAFRLGGRVFRLLLDVFLYNDFSINNFISGYKYCMLEHFLSCPLSSLCRPADQLPAAVEQLSAQQLEQLVQLPSVQRHVRSLPAERRQQLQQQRPPGLKSWVQQLMESSLTRCRLNVTALRCLFCLACRLPGALLGRQFRELYGRALLGELWSDEGYQRTMQLLKMLSQYELRQSLCDALQQATSEPVLRRRIHDHLDALDALDLARSEAPAAQENLPPVNGVGETATSLVDARTSVSKSLRTATDRQQLKQRLQSLGETQNQNRKPYEALRGSIIDDLHQCFKETISTPDSWPLHEVFVFDSVSSVRRRLVGAPRLALQTALAQPGKYLQCDCCQVSGDTGSVRASMPDLCVAYKLHVECGAMINMFDWLQAFQAVVAPDQPLDQHVQARFARAVAELQFLGFVRPTRRKTDHVTRLTWGSC